VYSPDIFDGGGLAADEGGSNSPTPGAPYTMGDLIGEEMNDLTDAVDLVLGNPVVRAE
jgi:hypothetical protein